VFLRGSFDRQSAWTCLRGFECEFKRTFSSRGVSTPNYGVREMDLQKAICRYYLGANPLSWTLHGTVQPETYDDSIVRKWKKASL
jgi:hypothetical protein